MTKDIEDKLIPLIKQFGKIVGDYDHPIDPNESLAGNGVDSFGTMELFLGIQKEWDVDCFELEDRPYTPLEQSSCLGANRLTVQEIQNYIQAQLSARQPQNQPSA